MVGSETEAINIEPVIHKPIDLQGKLISSEVSSRFRSIVFTPENQLSAGRVVANVKENGSFTSALLPGRYSVTVFAPNEQLPFAVSVDDGQQKVNWIEVERDTKQIVVEARVGACSLEGQLEAFASNESRSVAGVTVAGADNATNAIGEVDKRGHFRLDGLPCGEYSLLAWSNLDEVPYRRSDLIRNFSRHAVQAKAIPQRERQAVALEVQTFAF